MRASVPPAAVLFGLALMPVAGVPADYEGKRILRVQFEPARQPLLEREIERILPFRAGEQLRLDQLSLAIERLFESGRYADIAVDASLEDGQVVLRFLTTGNWFLGDISVSRINEPPGTGQMVSATRLELGGPFRDEMAGEAASRLLNLLRANGFYRSTVTHRIIRDPDTQQVAIRFDIEPGDRARFTDPVITGNAVLPARLIVRASRWMRFSRLLGYKQYTENRTQQGLQSIRRAYEKRNYLQADVQLESVDYLAEPNRVRPYLRVEAGPRVDIRASGAKLARGRLRQLVPVFQERSVDRGLLLEGLSNILQHFRAQGYFDASADFEVQPVENGRQLIEYVIDKGRRYKLVRVQVEGNRYFDDKTIRERLNIQEATRIRYRYGRFSEQLLQRDKEIIRDLYRSNGFNSVEVTSTVDSSYLGREGSVAVYLRIQEGPQWFVNSLEVTGVNPRELEEVQALLQSSAGQPYSEQGVAADRDALLAFYYNNGFPDASVEVTSTAAGPHRVDLRFAVTEGQRNFVRDVLVNGLQATNRDLVRSRIDVQPGEPLSQSRMIESQRRLYDLGVFARADIAVQNPQGRERSKYVVYDLEEARRYSLSLGFGAQFGRLGGSSVDLDAPAGSTGFSPRVSVGISRSNFWGLGHTVSLQGRLSNVQRRAIFNYLAPQWKDRDSLSLSVSGLLDDSVDVRTFAAKRREASLQLAQRYSKATTLQYRYSFRRVSVDPGSLKIDPALIPRFSQPARIGVFSSTLIRDRRDDPIESRKGNYTTVDVGVASSALGSQTSFSRLLVRNSSYYRLGRDLVLARATTFGTQNRFGSRESEIPLPELFFFGGANSHRGFPENQAGPRDLFTGYPIGGRAVLLNGFEVRFPLLGESLGGVLFHDAGNVYSRVSRISFRFQQRGVTDFDYMAQAVGLGLRYRTPVGPVRLDFSYGLNPPGFIGFTGTRDELIFGGGRRELLRISRFQFHFSLGQSF